MGDKYVIGTISEVLSGLSRYKSNLSAGFEGSMDWKEKSWFHRGGIESQQSVVKYSIENFKN